MLVATSTTASTAWCEKHSHQSRSHCGYLPRLDGLACANADAATDFESLP